MKGLENVFFSEYNNFYPFDVYDIEREDAVQICLGGRYPYAKPVIKAIVRQARKEGLWIRGWSHGYGSHVTLLVVTGKDVRRFKSLINYMNGKRFMSIFYHVGKEGRR